MGQSFSQRRGRTSVVRASTIARASVSHGLAGRGENQGICGDYNYQARRSARGSAPGALQRSSKARGSARGSIQVVPTTLKRADSDIELTHERLTAQQNELKGDVKCGEGEDIVPVGTFNTLVVNHSTNSDNSEEIVNIDHNNDNISSPRLEEMDDYDRMVYELYQREEKDRSRNAFSRFLHKKGWLGLSKGHWFATAIILCVIGLWIFVIFSEHSYNTHDNNEFGKLHAASLAQPYDYPLRMDQPLDYVEYHLETEWETSEVTAGSGGHRRRRNVNEAIKLARRATTNNNDEVHTGVNGDLLSVNVSVVELRNGTYYVLDGYTRSRTAADDHGVIIMTENVGLKNYKTSDGLALRVMINTNEPAPFVMKVYQATNFGHAQVALAGATLIFMYILIITEIVHRTIAALLGMTITLIWLVFMGKTPTVHIAFEWLEHGVLMLLFGMMLIVHVISTTGVFEWSAIQAYKVCRNKLWLLMVILSTITGVLSAFLDNVTTMLLMAPVTIRLALLINVDPRPLLLCECIMSNIGGTATMIGDPPNIIIGQALSQYIGFVDFLVHLLPGVVIMFPFCLWFLYFYFRKELDRECKIENLDQVEREYRIKNVGLLIRVGIIFTGVMVLFFTEPIHHVDVAWVALIGAVLMLVVATPKDAERALESVEWDTLVFFSALFIMIHGLSELGLIDWMGDVVGDLIALAPEEHQMAVAIVILIWVSGIISSFLDNIPWTLNMVPVIVALVNNENLNLEIEPLAWALAFGACLGGNGTIIGASANLVTGAIAARNNYEISFWAWFKVGFPTLLISLCFATLYCLVRYVWAA